MSEKFSRSSLRPISGYSVSHPLTPKNQGNKPFQGGVSMKTRTKIIPLDFTFMGDCLNVSLHIMSLAMG